MASMHTTIAEQKLIYCQETSEVNHRPTYREQEDRVNEPMN
jgi:hypothetical protein